MIRPIHYKNNQLNRFSAKKRSENNLLKEFREKFGNPTQVDIFFGNWYSHGNTFRGQETTKNSGFIKTFQSDGYRVFLLDEFRTSCVCFNCDSLRSVIPTNAKTP